MIITVSAVVMLVVAMVVLSIFGAGITPVTSLSDQRNVCLTQAAATCLSLGDVPFKWGITPTGGKSCRELTGCDSCSCISNEVGKGETFVGGIKISDTSIRF